MNGDRFSDPYEGMSDEEIEDETERLFDEPETAVELKIPATWYEHIKALAQRRGNQPVHQMMVRALNLGIRQIEAETAAFEGNETPPT